MQKTIISGIHANLSIIAMALAAIEAQLVMSETAMIAENKPEPAAPTVETGCAALVMPTEDLTGFARLMQELNDPRYTLRSIAELETKTGMESNEIEDALNDHDVEYVERTRRSDGAALIGLASRN